MSDLHSNEEGNDAVTIRRARPADATALLHLAALDEAEPLEGEVIVAEVDGELWAALDLADGRTHQRPVPRRRRGARSARAARGAARPVGRDRSRRAGASMHALLRER